MSEHDYEPVRGLPGRLPAGETMLWQGAPDWRSLAVHAMHVRLVGGYFAALAAWGMVSGSSISGIAATVALGAVAVGLLGAFAYASARTTVYTLTSKRLVLRFGVALPKCINLPLSQVATARVQALGHGHGDIALALTGPDRIGYIRLWPHVRAWRLSTPEPMLRSLPEIDAVAALLTRTLLAAVPAGRRVVPDAAQPDFGPQPVAA